MQRPIHDGTVELRDGHVLRWAQWGVTGGRPVLYFHGTPASRLDHLDDDELVAAGVELTTVDRPGVGGSSPRPGRRVIDWPADVEQLAEALELADFAVFGHSMGGSYALACAVALGDRITGVGLISSIAPWNEDGFTDLVPPYVQPIRVAYERDPDAATADYRAWMEGLRDGLLEAPEKAFAQFASQALSETDIALFEGDRRLRDLVQASMVEHVAGGIEGMFEERLAGHIMDWGFTLTDVDAHVDVFQGARDAMLPSAVGRRLAERLPRATYHEFEGAGHFLPRQHDRHLLNVVVGRAERPASTSR